MIKITKALLMAGLLATSTAIAAEPDEKDQKWATVVETMIKEGSTSVSTPSEVRVELARKLAAKHGLEIKVKSEESTFQIEFVKPVKDSVAAAK